MLKLCSLLRPDLRPAARALGLALASLLAYSASAAAQAPVGDPVAGKDKAYSCLGCHGIPGYHNVYPTYRVPRIAGQHAEYLVAALNGYRSGQRSHPTMQAQASSMSDQDIQDISAWLAQAPAHEGDVQTVAGGVPARGKELAATCTACHNETGISTVTQYPILAGQYPDYMIRTLRAYKSGKRKNAIMKGFAAQLSKQDMRDLAAWFAAQDSELAVIAK